MAKVVVIVIISLLTSRTIKRKMIVKIENDIKVTGKKGQDYPKYFFYFGPDLTAKKKIPTLIQT